MARKSNIDRRRRVTRRRKQAHRLMPSSIEWGRRSRLSRPSGEEVEAVRSKLSLTNNTTYFYFFFVWLRTRSLGYRLTRLSRPVEFKLQGFSLLLELAVFLFDPFSFSSPRALKRSACGKQNNSATLPHLTRRYKDKNPHSVATNERSEIWVIRPPG